MTVTGSENNFPVLLTTLSHEKQVLQTSALHRYSTPAPIHPQPITPPVARRHRVDKPHRPLATRAARPGPRRGKRGAVAAATLHGGLAPPPVCGVPWVGRAGATRGSAEGFRGKAGCSEAQEEADDKGVGGARAECGQAGG